jgi:predicted small integral membrane protein
MLITRLAKMVMCVALGLFCLLVAFDNITDDTRRRTDRH